MHHGSRAALFVMAGCLVLPFANAQTASREVPRTKSERTPFDAAVDSLGMERGVRRQQTSINAVFFDAKGKLDTGDGAKPVDHAIFSMSYAIPAIRTDVTRQQMRSIEVANGDIAWDEREPGIGAMPSPASAAHRLRQVWLTPQGALRAMVDARAKDKDAVKVAQTGKQTTFTLQFQGGPLEVVVDATHRPQTVKWTLANDVYEATFAGYKDWELLDVFFPTKIVQRVNGKVTADLTVTDFRSNPYVVFPIPADLRKKS